MEYHNKYENVKVFQSPKRSSHVIHINSYRHRHRHDDRSVPAFHCAEDLRQYLNQLSVLYQRRKEAW